MFLRYAGIYPQVISWTWTSVSNEYKFWFPQPTLRWRRHPSTSLYGDTTILHTKIRIRTVVTTCMKYKVQITAFARSWQVWRESHLCARESLDTRTFTVPTLSGVTEMVLKWKLCYGVLLLCRKKSISFEWVVVY
jgi:hypothetical protein